MRVTLTKQKRERLCVTLTKQKRERVCHIWTQPRSKSAQSDR